MQSHSKPSDDIEDAAVSRGVDVPSPWLTQREAASYLKLAVGTIRNLTSAHALPFARRGRIVRYRRDALDAWLVKGTHRGRRRSPRTACVSGVKGALGR